MTTQRNGRRIATKRQRGLALMLVLIVVAIAFILAQGMIAANSRATPVSQSVNRYAEVRLAAESAVEMTLAYIEHSATWRDDHVNGAWINNLTIGNVGVVVTVVDGEDLDGDGNLEPSESDGDLGDDPSDPVTVTALATDVDDLSTYRAMAVLRPGASSGENVYVTTGGGFKFNSNGYIDSFDSRFGRYGLLNKGSNATVRTNATGHKDGDIGSHGAIKGNAYSPPGTNPNQVFNPPGKVTGSVSTMSANAEFPDVTIPDVGADQGWLNANNTVTLAGNAKYQGINVNSGGKIVIDGNVTLVVTGSMNLGGSGIVLNPGATLTLYVNQMNVNSNSSINENTGKPALATIYLTGSSDNYVNSGAEVWAQIIAPNARLALNSGGHVYGTFIGKYLTINGNAAFHQDTNPDVGVVGGGGPPSNNDVRWVEAN